jgi:hypothetical protein
LYILLTIEKKEDFAGDVSLVMRVQLPFPAPNHIFTTAAKSPASEKVFYFFKGLEIVS